MDLVLDPEANSLGVQDNGTGFDSEEVKAAGRQSGFGLVGMDERVRLLRGTLAVRSQKGSGTLVEARIPMA